MNLRHFIIATAGHVDHGKSSLVKALTGTDPDRLPEEKARGITIDLGFAFLQIPSEADPAVLFDVGIIDVPGHEDFVKNMVAGVGSIDLALFVVAADDGWMPQTEEHLQILCYLGVERAVVALTKVDLLDQGRDQVIGEIRAQLVGTPFFDAPIIETSVTNGSGVVELKAALARELRQLKPPPDNLKPRLPVDRVFTLRGIGTVVTGTLTGGRFHRGQTVVVQPSGKTARIRALQNHRSSVEASEPGSRTAVNLPDVQTFAQSGAEGIRRGDVLTLPELGNGSTVMDVLLHKSGRNNQIRLSGSRAIKNGALVRVHHGSGNFPARVRFLHGDELGAGQEAIAQLRTDTPIFAMMGDRFVVRDWQEQGTLAGGTVLDPQANPKNFRSPSQNAYLQHVVRSGGALPELIVAQLARDSAVRSPRLLLRSRFSADEIATAAMELAQAGKAFIMGEWIVDGEWWRALGQQAMDTVDDRHRNQPQQLGVSLDELRTGVASGLPSTELFEAFIRALCQGQFEQVGSVMRRRVHRPRLPLHLEAAAINLRAALGAKPFEPPSRKELTPEPTTQEALKFLVETGEAVEISDEVVLLADHFASAVALTKRFLSQKGSATVSEIRQTIGSSRRVVVPLVEKLDRDGITRREGDKRYLKSGK